MKLCAAVPCYRHGYLIKKVLDRLDAMGLDTFVIDDGNKGSDLEALNLACAPFENIRLIRHQVNLGKGAAMAAAFRAAYKAGFDHLLQVDADGQHDLDDAEALIELAKKFPNDVISGFPIFDDKAPKSRVYGRRIANFWAALETCSLSIKDAMCGFRIYPLGEVARLYEKTAPGCGMDFDPEILVRLYWQGVRIHFLPTKVSYLPDGLSNFKVLKDNIRLSWMNTRLFCLMIPRLPILIKRKLQPALQPADKIFDKTFENTPSLEPVKAEEDEILSGHWTQKEEMPGLFGMRILMFLKKTLGSRVCRALIFPIAACYYPFAVSARKASRNYAKNLKEFAIAKGIKVPKVNTYLHIVHFARALLDKIDAWQGRLKVGVDLYYQDSTRELIDRICDTKKGCVVLTSHLGNIDACRALIEQHRDIVLNAVVFEGNAKTFSRVMAEFAPKSRLNLIDAGSMGPDTAMLLSQRLQEGQWLAIACDRLSVNSVKQGSHRTLKALFLGKKALFPAGPFVIAHLFGDYPLLQLFGVKRKGRIAFSACEIKRPDIKGRSLRDEALQQLCDCYVHNLEQKVLENPLEWFNFYDFWAADGAAEEQNAQH